VNAVIDAPGPESLETISCYYCGSEKNTHFTDAWEDLTGKPGTFHFVRCQGCGLVYQNPRVRLESIGRYYDDEYIAHRKKKDWGFMTPLYNWAMDKHDRQKARVVKTYKELTPKSRVLDVGCGAGTFLLKMNALYGAIVSGVDFKDLSALPGFDRIDFHYGVFCDQRLSPASFDLVTMWHFLEHDYDPIGTLQKAGEVLKSDGILIVEVPRLDSRTFELYRERWPGLQAPQHTVLYDKDMFLRTLERAGLKVIDYLPYGAFPAYFYLFAGFMFKRLKGKGLNLSKAVYPYFLGQLLLSPALLFEKKLNLAMQIAVCRRPK